jgi:DNA-binding phage protein
VQRESDTYQLAMVRAVRLLGGTAELAQRLEVPQSEVERWVAGEGRPSMGTFLKVMDILLEEGGKPR